MTFEELATGRHPDAEAELERDLLTARQTLFSGNTEGAINTYRRVARRAQQFDLTQVKERAQVGEAFCLERSGNLEGAADLYERLQSDIPDEHASIKADAVTGRSRCIAILGDMPYATYLLESFLSHLRRNNLVDPEAMLRLYTSLVATYFQGGLLKKAGDAAEEALALQSRVRDHEKVAGMHINVARVLMERGDYAGAARSFRAAEKIYRDLDLEGELGLTLLARSFLMKKQERYEEARENLEEALRIFETIGSEADQAPALSELGGLERITGNIDQAVFLLERAARMALKKQPGSAAISYRELALCHAALGHPTKVRSNFKKAIDLLESAGDIQELAITYRAYGDALRQEKDYQKACDAYRSAAITLEAA